MAIHQITIGRREFIRGGAVAGLAAAYPSLFAVTKGQKKPNILLIMSDEHNQTVTGCYGNKIIKTPNIDSLAHQGITLENHYCTSPLCVPSRNSVTAGKYSSRLESWGLTSELASDDMPSIARVMDAAGYESYLCGKMHYTSGRRYGFREIGGDFNHYKKTGKGKRFTPAQIKDTPLSPRFKDFHPGEDGSTVQHDRRVTRGTVEFLTKREAGKPFFLIAGFLTPHFPLTVPEAFCNYKDKVPMPTIPDGLVASLPTNYKLVRTSYKITNVPDDQVKNGREMYYGLTSWMDDQVGQVLAALRGNKAIADNTVIIYTTDHGENMGEHSMWFKSCMYDHATRVPMIISWPERWKGEQRRSQTSGHLDLVKTIAEIGGAHTPGDWDGDSLVPWLDNPKYKWKDFACAEFYAHSIAHGFVMARAGKWKYTYHGKPAADMPVERQLFDMEKDPGEFNNLAAQPQYAKLMADLHKRMEKEVGGDVEETEQRAREQLAKGYPVVFAADSKE